MPAIAGYLTTLKVTGTTTTMSSEAMSTNSTVANTYKIDAAAKAIWGRDLSFTFYEATTTAGRVAVAASAISSIDYLFGKVTFGSTRAEPVTVSGGYLPATNAAGANTYNMVQSGEMLDDTDFTSTGWRSRVRGLKDVSLTVSRWDSIDLDYYNLIDSGAAVVMEVRPGGTGSSVAARGFYKIESDAHSGDVASLEASELSFMLDGSTADDFSWGVV